MTLFTLKSAALAALAICVTTPFTLASGTHSHSHGAEDSPAFGKAADAAHADRVIDIIMTDNAFSLANLSVTSGEIITFNVHNGGDFLHEFNIGTQDMHLTHRGEMERMMMDDDADSMTMGHDDPNSMLLEPGEDGSLTWQFPAKATLEFACNVPGHYESGMMGAIEINPATN